jgi:hypothetical protein
MMVQSRLPWQSKKHGIDRRHYRHPSHAFIKPSLQIVNDFQQLLQLTDPDLNRSSLPEEQFEVHFGIGCLFHSRVHLVTDDSFRFRAKSTQGRRE